MARGINKRFRSAAAAATVAAALLALGTAAAPAQNGRRVTAAKPRLVATPRSIPPAAQIAPGDRIERLVELRMRGRGRFAAVYFRATATKSSGLDADAQHGLRIAITRCSRAWATKGAVHLCRGKRTVVLAQRRLVGRAKLRLGVLRPKTPAHLLLRVTFPADAGNALQAQATDATYSFVGVAR